MKLIKQLIALALNDELAKRDIPELQRVSVSANKLGFVRSYVTDHERYTDIDGVYLFTGAMVTMTRAIINGDENVMGYIDLCASLHERFTLPVDFNEELSAELKAFRTPDRLEPMDKGDRRTAVFAEEGEALSHADFNTLQNGVYFINGHFTHKNGSVEFDQYTTGPITMIFTSMGNTETVVFSGVSAITFSRRVIRAGEYTSPMSDWYLVPETPVYDSPSLEEQTVQLLTDIRDLLQVIRDERK